MTGRPALRVALVCGVVASAWPVPATFAFLDSAVSGAAVFPAVAVWAVLNVVLGALLIWRRPGLVYPWLMFCFGLLMVGLELVALNHRKPDDLYFVAGTLPALLAQLFPTGRPVSGRLGWLTYCGGLGLLDIVLTGSLLGGSPVMPVAGILWAVGLLATFPLVAVRFRRASGDERAQLKWFLFAVAAAVALWLGSSALAPVYPGTGTLALILGLSLPVAGMVVSLLRYRLYDIDRVISRTASYAVVTGMLIATYAAVTASISAVMGRGSTVTVAAATLVAAAVARPVLRRVQNVVDRRFNRTRYDALHTVDAFGHRLRSQVDPHQVLEDLGAVVNAALQPSHVALWLRAPR